LQEILRIEADIYPYEVPHRPHEQSSANQQNYRYANLAGNKKTAKTA